MAPTNEVTWVNGQAKEAGGAKAVGLVKSQALHGFDKELQQAGSYSEDILHKGSCRSFSPTSESDSATSTCPEDTAETAEDGLVVSAGAAISLATLKNLNSKLKSCSDIRSSSCGPGSPTSSVGTPKLSLPRSRFHEVSQAQSPATEGAMFGSNFDSSEPGPSSIHITFHAPPASPTPCHAPVEVIAKFPPYHQDVSKAQTAPQPNSICSGATAKRGRARPQPQPGGPHGVMPHGWVGGMPVAFGATPYFHPRVPAPALQGVPPPYMVSPTYAYGLMAPHWMHVSMAQFQVPPQQRYGPPRPYFGSSPNLSSPSFGRGGPMPPSSWFNSGGPGSDSSHSSGSTPVWKEGCTTPHSSSCPATPNRRNGGKTQLGHARGSAGSLHGSPAKRFPAALVCEDGEVLYSDVLMRFKGSREAREACCLEDVRGHVYAFCRDQVGSRFMQQALEGGDSALVVEIFEEVRPKLLQLVTDVFGNYVVQRMLELGEGVITEAIRDVLSGRVLLLSMQMYGCRVVQKALEVFDTSSKLAICQELFGHVAQCIKDQNGNHVVQKAIECVQPSDPIMPIIQDIVAKTKQLSCHPFGCRLVQRVLEHCTVEDVKQQAIRHILGVVAQLSFDQYGNYVVQHLAAKGPEDARAEVVAASLPQLARMARHKYASNVVEVCIKYGSDEQRDAMFREFAGGESKGAQLLDVMRDQYGNYVVRRALEVANEQQLRQLLPSIQPHLPALQKAPYGRHLAMYAANLMSQQSQLAPFEQADQHIAAATFPAPAATAPKAVCAADSASERDPENL